jgi:murein DD-endopeptidase MepM/ murein hydrolase activator NlpD
MYRKIQIVLVVLLLLIIAKKIRAKSSNNMNQNNKSKLRLLPLQKLRNDSAGKGHFGAPRGTRKHQGYDLLATAGQDVHFNLDGYKVLKIGNAYANTAKYKSLHLQKASGDIVKLLYVKAAVKVGDIITPGELVGEAQDIAAKWGGGMLNHIHVEVIINGEHQDPAQFLHLD